MRVLVTGANGFLGKVICEQLRSESINLITTDKVGNNIDYVGDLSDEKFVNSLPDVGIILHLASVQYVTPNLPFFFRHSFFIKNNVHAAKNLVNRYEGQLEYFLNVSTSMLYEQKPISPYAVTATKKPSGIYSQTKLMALELLQSIKAKNQANIYPCIILGKGREGLFRGFIERINHYKLVILPGKCEHKTAVVHVDDVANTIVQLLNKRAQGDFNVMASKALSIKQWVEEIESCLNKKAKYRITIPLWLIKIIAFLTAYRFLAKEQVLMLEYPHSLDIDKNYNLDIAPKIQVNQCINDIVNYIVKKA